MYTWLLAACVGFNTFSVRLFWPGILPLRWRPFQTLSAVPFDLLVLYYAMPLAIRIIRPGSLMRKLSRQWWSQAAHFLRLSNYLLGKEALSEQGRVEYTTWAAWLRRRATQKAIEHGLSRQGNQNRSTAAADAAQQRQAPQQHQDQPIQAQAQPEAAVAAAAADPAVPNAARALEGSGWKFVPDGTFARVPADDVPAPNSRMFIMLDREGVPVDAEMQRALEVQQRAIDRMTKKPKYEIVYLPPNFRLRIYALLFLFWVTISIGIQISIAGPLIVGRLIFACFTHTAQHDFYAWSLGCPVLAIPASAAYRVYHHQRRRARRRREQQQQQQALAAQAQQAQGGEQLQQQPQQPANGAVQPHGPPERPTIPRVQKLRALCRQTAVLLYFGLMLGIVIPFLIGMIVRVYLIEPWLDVSQLAKPVPVFQTWAMGLMEQALFVRLIALQNDGWAQALTNAIDRTVRNGIGKHMQPWQTTKGVILPVLSALVLLLTAPPLQVGLNFALRAGPPLTPTLQQNAVRAAYKWFSFGLATAKVLRMIVVRIDQWTMALKDELFLESTELTNYRPDDGVGGGGGAAFAAGGGGGRGAGRANGLRGVEEDDDGLGAVGLLPDRFI